MSGTLVTKNLDCDVCFPALCRSITRFPEAPQGIFSNSGNMTFLILLIKGLNDSNLVFSAWVDN